MNRFLNIALPAALTLVLSLPAGASFAQARGASSCSGAYTAPAAGNLDKVADATLCLVNTERTTRDLKALKTHGALHKAARKHSADMAQRNYFAHDTKGGGSFTKRILTANYTRPNATWTIGENLAWGTGSLATPAATVEAWMRSPGHRANILQAKFREIGIGIVQHDPKTLYTTDFGRRG